MDYQGKKVCTWTTSPQFDVVLNSVIQLAVVIAWACTIQGHFASAPPQIDTQELQPPWCRSKICRLCCSHVVTLNADLIHAQVSVTLLLLIDDRFWIICRSWRIFSVDHPAMGKITIDSVVIIL